MRTLSFRTRGDKEIAQRYRWAGERLFRQLSDGLDLVGMYSGVLHRVIDGVRITARVIGGNGIVTIEAPPAPVAKAGLEAFDVGSFLFVPVKRYDGNIQVTYGEPYVDGEGNPIPGTDGGDWPQQRLDVRTDGGYRVIRDVKEAMFYQNYDDPGFLFQEPGTPFWHWTQREEQWWADANYQNIISIDFSERLRKGRYAQDPDQWGFIHNGTYWDENHLLGAWIFAGRFIKVAWDSYPTLAVYADTGIDPGNHLLRTWEQLDTITLGGTDILGQAFWARPDGAKAISFVFRAPIDDKKFSTYTAELEITLDLDGSDVVGSFTLTDVTSEYPDYADTFIGNSESKSYTVTSQWVNASGSPEIVQPGLEPDPSPKVYYQGCEVTDWVRWASTHWLGASEVCNPYSNCAWNEYSQAWDYDYYAGACSGDEALKTGIWAGLQDAVYSWPIYTEKVYTGVGGWNGEQNQNDSPCSHWNQWEYQQVTPTYADYTAPLAWTSPLVRHGQPIAITTYFNGESPPAYVEPTIPDSAVMNYIDETTYPVDYAEGLALIQQETLQHSFTWEGIEAEFDWGPLDGAHILHKWRPAFTSSQFRSWPAEHYYLTTGPSAQGLWIVKVHHQGTYLYRSTYRASGKKLLAMDYRNNQIVRLTLEYSGDDNYDTTNSVDVTSCGITGPTNNIVARWNQGQKAEYVCGAQRFPARYIFGQPPPGFGNRYSLIGYTNQNNLGVGTVFAADLRSGAFILEEAGADYYAGAWRDGLFRQYAVTPQAQVNFLKFEGPDWASAPSSEYAATAQIAVDRAGNAMFSYSDGWNSDTLVITPRGGVIGSDGLEVAIFGESSAEGGEPKQLTCIPCRPMTAPGVEIPEYTPFDDPWNR